MGRPRKSTIDEICDQFSDMPLDSQDGLLLTLAQIHRQMRRQSIPAASAPNCAGTASTSEDDIEESRR